MNMMNKELLSSRMRPMSISDIVGHQNILGEGKILSRVIKAQQSLPIILYGPPGIGKTSIALALSKDLKMPLSKYNASEDGKKELERIVSTVSAMLPGVILVDEIHRLNKPNQDFLLRYVEEGHLILIGATTENPYMSIQQALRSRSVILEMKAVSPEDIVTALKRALVNKKRGLGNMDIIIEDKDLLYIAEQSNGDVRLAMNTLGLAVASTDEDSDGSVHLTTEVIEDCLQATPIGGDKDGESHYNLMSALQKSIRGSDADAAIHYLVRMLRSGDLETVVRRLKLISYEDIGLAGSSIHLQVIAATDTALKVGLKESIYPLSDIVTRLALHPKSDVAYMAYKRAEDAIESGKNLEIPSSLKDNHYKGAKDLGRGIGYQNPHRFPDNIMKQQYLPDDFVDDRYLVFKDENDQKNIQDVYNDRNNKIK